MYTYLNIMAESEKNTREELLASASLPYYTDADGILNYVNTLPPTIQDLHSRNKEQGKKFEEQIKILNKLQKEHNDKNKKDATILSEVVNKTFDKNMNNSEIIKLLTNEEKQKILRRMEHQKSIQQAKQNDSLFNSVIENMKPEEANMYIMPPEQQQYIGREHRRLKNRQYEEDKKRKHKIYNDNFRKRKIEEKQKELEKNEIVNTLMSNKIPNKVLTEEIMQDFGVSPPKNNKKTRRKGGDKKSKKSKSNKKNISKRKISKKKKN